MKISYNWLQQFLEVDWDSQQIAEVLTDLGLEVEGISPFESVKGGLQGVVVGQVLSCVPHPNADRLKLTTVDVGEENPLQIVCGAPNVAVGQNVAVAPPGTTLYTLKGKALQLKKSTIRGQESQGMLCAEDELGLGEKHNGILVLDEGLKPGTPCAEVFGVETDTIFNIELTPNRADAMSHFGVARDLRAGLEQKEVYKNLITPSTSQFSIDNRSLKIDVTIENTDLAPRYCGLTLSGIKVQESPQWLKTRLRAIGLSPKNNVVDITNYVLHELGQPLHAFDAAKIKGHTLSVKTLPAGTTFITLDGVVHELHEDDLMICDAEKPLCIAGVLGGSYASVTESTTSIFLESAYFNPVSIRKTAKRHGIATDASFRFERGIDINTTEYTLKRAAILIREIAGGYISSDIVDWYPKKLEEKQVFLTFDKINSLIGQEIPQDTIKSILASLEIKVKNVTEAGLGLSIPSYRVDVEREVDVIEEILRVYGYNTIADKEKLTASIATTQKIEAHRVQHQISDMLTAQGFYEIMTNSLVGTEMHMLPGAPPNAVRIANPLSAALSTLRTSMLFTGLQTVAYNHNRQNTHLKLFEFGRTYHQTAGKSREQQHLCLFLSGERSVHSWTKPPTTTDFFLLKGLVEAIFERLGLKGLKEEPSTTNQYAEGLQYTKNQEGLCAFGRVNSALLKSFDIKQDVFFADFNWDSIVKQLSVQNIAFTPLPRFPEVTRDLSLLLDTAVTFKQVYDLAWNTEKKLLKNVHLFDVYTGHTLPQGKKSYAVSFTLSDERKTLTDTQVDAVMAKLLAQYQKELGAELR